MVKFDLFLEFYSFLVFFFVKMVECLVQCLVGENGSLFVAIFVGLVSEVEEKDDCDDDTDNGNAVGTKSLRNFFFPNLRFFRLWAVTNLAPCSLSVMSSLAIKDRFKVGKRSCIS